MVVQNLDKVRSLAKDLRAVPPRSPREKLAGYVILAGSVTKCRAFLLGINGEYNYQPCSLAAHFFTFTGITAEQLKEFVATGATDADIAEWVKRQASNRTPIDIIRWNNTLRDMRISEMDDHAQESWRSTSTFICHPICRCITGLMSMTLKKSDSDQSG